MFILSRITREGEINFPNRVLWGARGGREPKECAYCVKRNSDYSELPHWSDFQLQVVHYPRMTTLQSRANHTTSALTMKTNC